MRVVGLLMVLLGGLIGWEVLQGKDPRTHLYQLINLLFRTNLQVPGGASAGSSSSLPAQVGGAAVGAGYQVGQWIRQHVPGGGR